MNNESLKTLNFVHIAQAAAFAALKTYERIRTKNSENFSKQTQFLRGRNLWKVFIYKELQENPPSGGIKNKPNSNPIKPNFGPKIRVANPIQTQTNPILSGAKLISLKGVNLCQRYHPQKRGLHRIGIGLEINQTFTLIRHI